MSLSRDAPRQPRVTRPTAKLVDINNGEKAPLTFQRAAVAAAVTARIDTHVAPPSESLPPSSDSSLSTLTQQASFNTNDDDLSQESDLPTRAIPAGSKRQIVISSDDEGSIEGSKQKKKQKSKGK